MGGNGWSGKGCHISRCPPKAVATAVLWEEGSIHEEYVFASWRSSFFLSFFSHTAASARLNCLPAWRRLNSLVLGSSLGPSKGWKHWRAHWWGGQHDDFVPANNSSSRRQVWKFHSEFRVGVMELNLMTPLYCCGEEGEKSRLNPPELQRTYNVASSVCTSPISLSKHRDGIKCFGFYVLFYQSFPPEWWISFNYTPNDGNKSYHDWFRSHIKRGGIHYDNLYRVFPLFLSIILKYGNHRIIEN